MTVRRGLLGPQRDVVARFTYPGKRGGRSVLILECGHAIDREASNGKARKRAHCRECLPYRKV